MPSLPPKVAYNKVKRTCPLKNIKNSISFFFKKDNQICRKKIYTRKIQNKSGPNTEEWNNNIVEKETFKCLPIYSIVSCQCHIGMKPSRLPCVMSSIGVVPQWRSPCPWCMPVHLQLLGAPGEDPFPDLNGQADA